MGAQNMKNFFLALVVSILTVQAVVATETDNFTKRDLERDALSWLNEKMNQAIQMFLQKAKPGDVRFLQAQLFKNLGGLLWAKIELWSKESGSPAEHIPFEQSIFRDVGNIRGDESLFRKLTPFKKYYTSGVYRIDNIVFGDDKLGHFLQLGYAMYYAKMRKENPKFRDARPLYVRFAEVLSGDKKFRDKTNLTGDELVFAYSRFQEGGEWGYRGPMARSYADIAANIEGYKFWSSLTDGENPYVKMSANGKWEQTRMFTWAEYVTPAWDEAVNRSDYHDRIKNQVEARIQQVIGENCSDLTACRKKIFEHYGDTVIHIFNNKCSPVYMH